MGDFFDKIPGDWAAAFITGFVAWVGAKLWGKASDKQQAIIEAAIEEVRSLIDQIVITARPGTTVEEIETWSKAIVVKQLTKRGIDPENPLVKALTSKVIAGGITMFVARQSVHGPLVAPILKKLEGVVIPTVDELRKEWEEAEKRGRSWVPLSTASDTPSADK